MSFSIRAEYPCGRISRRNAIYRFGLLGSAIGTLWGQDGKLSQGLVEAQKFPQKAKSVILLFMCGGVSHIDTFDPKDNKWAGTIMDAIRFGDNLAQRKRPVIPCRRTFKKYGESGIPVSNWFPNVGSVIDDIAVVRSFWSHETNHFPAVLETTTAHRGRQFDWPTLGSWVSYALGSANQTFVNMGRPSSSLQLSGGFMGATVAATAFQTGDTPIGDLNPPKDLSASDRDRQMETMTKLNQVFREEYALNNDIATRLRAYELAARMQFSAPPLVDFSNEPQSVLSCVSLGQRVQPATMIEFKEIEYLTAFGQRGVVRVIELLRAELGTDMGMAGVAKISQIDHSYVCVNEDTIAPATPRRIVELCNSWTRACSR